MDGKGPRVQAKTPTVWISSRSREEIRCEKQNALAHPNMEPNTPSLLSGRKLARGISSLGASCCVSYDGNPYLLQCQGDLDPTTKWLSFFFFMQKRGQGRTTQPARTRRGLPFVGVILGLMMYRMRAHLAYIILGGGQGGGRERPTSACLPKDYSSRSPLVMSRQKSPQVGEARSLDGGLVHLSRAHFPRVITTTIKTITDRIYHKGRNAQHALISRRQKGRGVYISDRSIIV